MANPVIVRFQVDGVALVQNAIQKLEDSFVKAETGKTAAGVKGTKARISEAEKEARAKVKEEEKAAKEYERIQTRSALMAGALAAKEAKEQAAIRTQSALYAGKLAADAAAKEVKLSQQVLAQKAKDEQAHTAQVARGARDRADAVIAGLKREESEARASRRRFAQAIGTAVGTGAMQGVSQATRMAAGMVGSVLQIGGGFTIAGAVQQHMAVDRMAVIASNAAYDPTAKYDPRLAPGEQKSVRQDPKVLAKRAREVAIASGIDATELMEGTKDYIDKASDWKGGVKNMEAMARIAKSTGSKYTEVTSALGMLKAQNPDMTEKQGEQMLYNIAAQSVRGSISFADVAHNAAGLGKNSFNMVGDQTDLQAQMIGLSQLAVKTGGTAAPTTTEISNFFSAARKNAKTIGLKTDSSGNIDNGDVAEVIGKIFLASHGDKNIMQGTKEGHFGISERGIKLPMSVEKYYREGKEEALKKGASAEEANKAGALRVTETIRATTNVKGNKDTVDANFNAALRKVRLAH